MNIIHSIFSLVLKFRSQLISQPWGPASGPCGPEHPSFALMQQSYSTFKYYSHFLFKGDPSPGPGRDRWGGGGAELLTDPPPSSGEQAGEPRLPAPPGGLPAAHQLQQLLPGRLRPVWRGGCLGWNKGAARPTRASLYRAGAGAGPGRGQNEHMEATEGAANLFRSCVPRQAGEVGGGRASAGPLC